VPLHIPRFWAVSARRRQPGSARDDAHSPRKFGFALNNLCALQRQHIVGVAHNVLCEQLEPAEGDGVKCGGSAALRTYSDAQLDACCLTKSFSIDCRGGSGEAVGQFRDIPPLRKCGRQLQELSRERFRGYSCEPVEAFIQLLLKYCKRVVRSLLILQAKKQSVRFKQ